MGDETYANEALTKLKALGLTDKDIDIKKTTFYLETGKLDEVIKILGGDNGNN